MTTSTTEIARIASITASAFAAEGNVETLAWVAEAPESRWATTLVEDQAYWSAKGIETGLDLAHLLASETLYDLYKEVHGIRPRWMDMGAMSLTELESLIDSLCETAREQAEEEARWEAEQAEREAAEAARVAEDAAWAPIEAAWEAQDALMGF